MGIRDGLLMELLFDGNASDSSGNRVEAQVVGATLTKDRFGKDSAYSFNGQDQYIVIEKAPVLSDQAFSLSVWAKYGIGNSLKGWNNAIISQDSGDQHNRRVFQLSTEHNKTTWHRFYDGSPEVVVPEPVITGRWYHFAVVYEGGKHRLYRNGVLMDEKPGKWVPNQEEPIYIGRKGTGERSFFFKGAIDDIRIYNRALSEQDILELVTEGGWITPNRVLAARRAKSDFERVELKHKREPNQKLVVENSSIYFSTFVNVSGEFVKWFDASLPGMQIENADLSQLWLNDVNLRGARISDANMSNLQMDGVQLGGASIRNIGMPPKGHPLYKEGQEQRPLQFEKCDLHGSVIRECDLTGVTVEQCNVAGMTINGISVEELLRVYRQSNG